MGLLDFAPPQQSGGGLLDFAFNDPGARLGISLLAASSPRLQGLGQVMAQQDAWKQNQNDAAWQKMQRERQTREWALQDKENALASQFFRPATPGLAPLAGDESTGILPSAGRAASPASFDTRGFANALMTINPARGMQMLQGLQKESPINKLDVKDFTPTSVQKFQQTGNYGDLVRLDKAHFADTGGTITALDSFTGRPINEVQKSGNPFKDLLVSDGQGGMRPNSPLIAAKSAIARAGASNVSVTTKQEGEEAKAVGKFFGDNYADIQKSGFTAQNTINRYNRLSQLLDGVDTGKFAPLGLEVAKTAQSIGLNVDPNLANKEAAVALSSEIALQLRNPAGGAGMPGAMSDSDRNFLAGMVPGIEKTPEGRQQIVETAKKLAQRDMEVAKMAREYRGKNGTINEGFYNQLAQYSESNPLFGGAAAAPKAKAFSSRPPANSSNRGKFLTDTETGQRFKSNGISWEEVR